MEDVTNPAFRRIVKRIGRPGLMVSEFVSAMATHYNAKKQLDKLEIYEDDHPISIQIFGSDPDIMAEAAKLVEGSGSDICDINMGCSVPKVCRTGSGAALLKDPDHALKIVEAVVKAVSIPVTVKFRVGWNHEQIVVPDLARRFEEAGVKAVTLHARTAMQGFSGRANWDFIGEIKQAVSIPVIGNGDIKEPHDALLMMQQTGCDGVMIGRASISNPWIILRVGHYLATGELLPEPTILERCEVALEHLRLMTELMGDELRATRHLRGQIPLYVKNFPGAAKLRGDISQAKSIAEVEDILSEIAWEPED